METIKNGNPNFSNERVLASFMDLMGMSLTQVLVEISEGKLTEDGLRDLGNLCRMMGNIRASCGVNTEWHGENLFFEAIKYCNDADASRKTNRPSPAEVAEAILNDLNN
jgi:hypothetical protein